MKKVTRRFVQYFYPGLVVADDSTAEVPLDTKPQDVEWPEGAYCFRMTDRDDMVDGQNVYQGKPRTVGKEYWHPDSKVRTLAECKEIEGRGSILVSNMRMNDWPAIVYTRFGNWPQPWDDNTMEILR